MMVILFFFDAQTSGRVERKNCEEKKLLRPYFPLSLLSNKISQKKKKEETETSKTFFCFFRFPFLHVLSTCFAVLFLACVRRTTPRGLLYTLACERGGDFGALRKKVSEVCDSLEWNALAAERVRATRTRRKKTTATLLRFPG